MAFRAVVLAAGLGSRMLPITRVLPKELLPVLTPSGVLRPAIDLVIDELADAGIEEILMITSPRKHALEDWFDRDLLLEHQLAGSPHKLALVTERRPVRITFLRQGEPRGTGHAIALARDFVRDEPFIVAFPDDVFVGGPNPVLHLIETWRHTGGAVLGSIDLQGADPSAYGILDAYKREDGVLSVRRVVEKPDAAHAPSSLASVGRYLYTPALFERLLLTRPQQAHLKEITPMPALEAQGAAGELFAATLSAPHFDLGHVQGWLDAIDFGKHAHRSVDQA